MAGARKEVVIAGPGSGKTEFLALVFLTAHRAIAIDPVGALSKLLVPHGVPWIRYDVHGEAQFKALTKAVAKHLGPKGILIDTEALTRAQGIEFADWFGTWLRQNYRDGHLVIDELKWVVPGSPLAEHGMVEFIAKCRNYNVALTATAHRNSGLNSDIVGLADTFRVGRCVHPRDREAAAKILSGQVSARDLDALAARLSSLGPGQWLLVEGAAPG